MKLFIISFIFWSVLITFPYLLLALFLHFGNKQKVTKKHQKEIVYKFFRITSFALPALLYFYWQNELVKGLFYPLLFSEIPKGFLSVTITIVGGIFLIISTFVGNSIPNYIATRKIERFKPPFVRFCLFKLFFLMGIVSLNITFELVYLLIPILVKYGAISPLFVAPLTLLFAILIYLLFHQYFPGILSKVFGYSKVENPQLIKLFAQLSIRTGVKLKSLRILKGQSLRVANGWAYGLFSHHVCLTDILVARLTLDELEAVLAHELGHVKQRHIWLNLIAIGSAIIFVSIISAFLGLFFPDNSIVFILYEIFSILLIFTILISVAKLNEYRADRFSADVTSNPQALISALKKLTGGKRKVKKRFLRFFSLIGELVMIHPSFERREKALSKRGAQVAFLPKQLQKRLNNHLLLQKPIIIAYSGGCDSAYLAKIASQHSASKTVAITCKTPYMASDDMLKAKKFAQENGINHIVLDVGFLELLKENPEMRCYHCKQYLMKKIQKKAKEMNYSQVVDGSNLDDYKKYRPGRKALVELGIRSPLAEVGFCKKEVRHCSMQLGLSSALLPSNSCLLTRFPHNYLVTKESLRMVEKAEMQIKELGYKIVRVRVADEFSVSIEVEPEKAQLMSSKQSEKIVRVIKSVGFNNVSISKNGYVL